MGVHYLLYQISKYGLVVIKINKLFLELYFYISGCELFGPVHLVISIIHVDYTNK